jgi:thiol peroxidase
MTAQRTITFHGEKFALLGNSPDVGTPAPDFRLSYFNKAEEGGPVERNDLLALGKPVLLSVITSVDTPFGRIQSRKFDKLLRPFRKVVTGVLISSDLPFTLNRFKEIEQIKVLTGLSDYFDQSFGRAFGVVVEEALVLAMAVFVIDTAGVVQYEEVVPEVTNEPDYAAAMAALEALLLPHKRRTARRRPPAARKRTVSRATKKT